MENSGNGNREISENRYLRKNKVQRTRSDVPEILKTVYVKKTEPAATRAWAGKRVTPPTVRTLPGTVLTPKQVICIKMLKKRAAELGRLPKKCDMRKEQVGQVRNAFGFLSNALIKAGLIAPSLKWLEKQECKKQKRAERKQRCRINAILREQTKQADAENVTGGDPSRTLLPVTQKASYRQTALQKSVLGGKRSARAKSLGIRTIRTTGMKRTND